jgi:hypothetical protein
VVEPARRVNWSARELQIFLDGLLYAFARLEGVDAAARDRLVPAFERFIVAIRAVCATMYQLPLVQ